MTRLITIEEIEENMELAHPVKNKLGQVLLGSDMLLKDKHKKILKTWGIEYISIKEKGTNKRKLEYSVKQIQDAKLILDQRFEWDPKNNFERELYEIALNKVLVNNFKPVQEMN